MVPVNLILFTTEFEHTQISVPKIDIPALKAACINPWGPDLITVQREGIIY